MIYSHTWEQAVEWLRIQPDKQDLVRHCYYDDPLESAAERFYQSEEWEAVATLLGQAIPGKVLDIGAGRGISSYAFARSNCQVTALEPYPSEIVGSHAICSLVRSTGLSVDVVEESGETMPFEDNTFDVVYCRAALHHANDFGQLCVQAGRVLKPGGTLLATREHVLSRSNQLEEFLQKHPLHFLYGGEHAYTLKEYLQALKYAGLRLQRNLGPYESIVNYSPMSRSQLKRKIATMLAKRLGESVGQKVSSFDVVEKVLGRYLSFRSNSPGRLYSFIAKKAH